MSHQEKKELQKSGCMLCTSFKKAHYLRESGKTTWSRINQRSKGFFEDTNHRIIESSKDFSEQYPTMASCIKNSGQKIVNTTRRMSSNIAIPYQQGNDGVKRIYSHVKESDCLCCVSRFIVDNSSSFFLCGTTKVIFAAVFLALGMFPALSGCFLIFGAILIVLPSVSLINQVKEQANNQRSIINTEKEAPSNELQKHDYLYTSVDLSGPVTPPLIFQDMKRTSDATFGLDPLCQVHHLSKTISDISVQRSDAQRSQSLDNLHGTTDRKLLLNGV